MKSKMLVLFFAVLTLSQAGWSQRVDNGTEGLALSNVNELPQGSDVERILAAFEKGSIPSEDMLRSFGEPGQDIILNSFVYRYLKYSDEVSQAVCERMYDSLFKYEYLYRGDLLPKQLKIDFMFLFISIFNPSYIPTTTFERSSLFTNSSETYNALVAEKDRSSKIPIFFIREYMNNLIILEINPLTEDLTKERRVPNDRILNNFSSDSYKVVIDKVYYMFKGKK